MLAFVLLLTPCLLSPNHCFAALVLPEKPLHLHLTLKPRLVLSYFEPSLASFSQIKADNFLLLLGSHLDSQNALIREVNLALYWHSLRPDLPATRFLDDLFAKVAWSDRLYCFQVHFCSSKYARLAAPFSLLEKFVLVSSTTSFILELAALWILTLRLSLVVALSRRFLQWFCRSRCSPTWNWNSSCICAFTGSDSRLPFAFQLDLLSWFRLIADSKALPEDLNPQTWSRDLQTMLSAVQYNCLHKMAQIRFSFQWPSLPCSTLLSHSPLLVLFAQN